MKLSVITLIIPCFNEADTLPELYNRLRGVADTLSTYTFEWLFVNDGSTDATPAMLNALSAQDARVKVLHVAINQGHQIALSAGMDFASGDVMVMLDADLQDPPEVLLPMLQKIQEGYDLVHAQRCRRAGETWFKLATARLFYAFLQVFSPQAIIPNYGDFRAFTRPVLEVARRFRERHKFWRGSFVMFGFRQGIIQYDRDQRYAGATKYPLPRMVRLSLDALLGFSSLPLKIITYLSFGLFLTSGIYIIRSLLLHFVWHTTVRGWTSLIVLMAFFTSLQLFCLAIIGAYIGRIFEQGQQRPLYWLSDTRNINFDSAVRSAPDIQEILISRAIATHARNDHDPTPTA